MAVLRQRLDLSMVKRRLAASRQRAQAMIMAGKVWVNDILVDKPGTQVMDRDRIQLKEADMPFVSRGGLKLAGALDALQMDPGGRICLDVGASTGGFTDCLLQRGAARVYAVDVGYGQLAWSLRQDPRVVVIERTNIRHMPPSVIGEPIDLVVIDASFISLKIVVPAALRFLRPEGEILALIKPQFEVGKGRVGKGGVVRDPALHDQVILDLSLFFTELGLDVAAVVPSPVLGPKGNREFVAYLKFTKG
jgi:23S rRNA (cytidine1920-2'-O)/16S rRNA (cytidine1409-2'-O)-methyltransferase